MFIASMPSPLTLRQLVAVTYPAVMDDMGGAESAPSYRLGA